MMTDEDLSPEIIAASTSSPQDLGGPSARAETPALMTSVGFHLLLIFLAALFAAPASREALRTVFTTEAIRPVEDVRLLTEPLAVREIPVDDVGHAGAAFVQAAETQANLLAEMDHIPPPELRPTLAGSVQLDFLDSEPQSDRKKSSIITRGSGGTAVASTRGAVDRITHEILLSLEQQPTLVVWLLDRSPSVYQQRREIQRRLDRIYQELGTVQSRVTQGNPSVHEPLVSSVIAFGNTVTVLTPTPTSDVAQLQQAIAQIEEDGSGIENVFQAVQLAVEKYRHLRHATRARPARSVMLVLFTDEAGDDPILAEAVVRQCQRFEIPVYVVGVPAPFGQFETQVKWVDPDTQFDQTPRWGVVHQGPETCSPETVQLGFADGSSDYDYLDSGFGPYHLTWLCVETGGIYFTVHPNRRVGPPVGRWETDTYSSFLHYFFAPETMRRYQPDYISPSEYQRQVRRSPVRRAVVEAAQFSRVQAAIFARREFIIQSEAQFVEELSEAQKEAARLEPLLERLHQILRAAEPHRSHEDSPRWQASFDLALGRVLANRVRTDGYNVLLAQAKRGLRPDRPGDNVWTLVSIGEVPEIARLKEWSNSARTYLERVLAEHDGTPWAVLARKELEIPLGFEWRSSYRELAPQSTEDNDIPDPVPPSDDQRRMLERPKPTRPIPRL